MNSDYLVGTVLENRYEILEIIGSGGMATVYKAKCRALNRYVAIKVLKDSYKNDGDIVKKFKAESRAAACLSHQNIVQVYDVNEYDGLDYIVMEYIDGITLKQYISKQGRLEWEEAFAFAAQIGKALETAHKNHIIHKDIKPHNVLITNDGVAKVADFGIAQVASSDTIVAGKANMGSVHYSSPEQSRGGYTDERSDIYSLGIVMYEMLTGRVPFDGENPVAIAVMKLENEPMDCRIINPDIPENVGKIVMKAIAKEQHLRYQSAAEMVSDIEKIINDDSAELDDSEERYETNRIDKNKTEERYYMRKNVNRRRKKKNNIKWILLVVGIALIFGIGTYFLMTGGKREYQVPDLKGCTIEEAEELLKENNLLLSDDIDYEESEEVDEGIIIDQKPGANQPVKKNRKIKVVVSLGFKDGEIEIPDLSDMTVDEAKKKLEKADLTYEIVEEYDEKTEIGELIRQLPKEGTKVKEGYKVILYVCKASDDEQVVVPKLTGNTEAQATALLQSAGLSAGTIDKVANSAPQGTVIAQTPAAKTGVVKGSKVDFTVSNGPADNPENPPEEEKPILKRKTLTITIPDDANDVVHIKVVANGKVIHDKDHPKTDGTVDIEVQASKDASVQAYIDGNLVVDKVISFD